jgi:transcriptional regulator with XRE-family HTH domain
VNTLGDRIAYLVAETGLTKTAFAERIGLSQQYVSGICTNAKNPSDRTIADICRVFGVEELWLRTGEGEMFRQRTDEEELAEFFADVLNDAPEATRRQIITNFARFNEEDWRNFTELIHKFFGK